MSDYDRCFCDQYDCHGITALVEGTATLRAERDALRQEVERLRNTVDAYRFQTGMPCDDLACGASTCDSVRRALGKGEP